MFIESLVELCIARLCTDVGSYSDIINSLWGEIPKNLINRILRHHTENCLTIELKYVKLLPSYINVYRKLICTDCYIGCDDAITVINRINIQKRVWKNIANAYTCEYCGTVLTIYMDNSCNCE